MLDRLPVRRTSELPGWKGAASLSAQDYKRAKTDTDLMGDQAMDDDTERLLQGWREKSLLKKSEGTRVVLGSDGSFEPDKHDRKCYTQPKLIEADQLLNHPLKPYAFTTHISLPDLTKQQEITHFLQMILVNSPSVVVDNDDGHRSQDTRRMNQPRSPTRMYKRVLEFCNGATKAQWQYILEEFGYQITNLEVHIPLPETIPNIEDLPQPSTHSFGYQRTLPHLKPSQNTHHATQSLVMGRIYHIMTISESSDTLSIALIFLAESDDNILDPSQIFTLRSYHVINFSTTQFSGTPTMKFTCI